MTLQEIMEDAWRGCGEPSDFIPGTIDSDGELVFDTALTLGSSQKLLKLVNRAYKHVCGYRFKNGDLLRFDTLEETAYFKSRGITGTADGGADGSITLDSAANLYPAAADNDGLFVGWVIEVTGGTGQGQTRYVTKYDGTTRVADVHVDWKTNPDATSEYQLYKNFFPLVGSTDVRADYGIVLDSARYLSAVGVSDLEDERKLAYRERTERFVGRITDSGDPGIWYMYRGKVFFDFAVKEEKWFEFRYIASPAALTVYTDVPDIPDIWHEAIVMWVVWWYVRWDRDLNAGYAFKRDFEDFMETTKKQTEMGFEEVSGHIEVRLK